MSSLYKIQKPPDISCRVVLNFNFFYYTEYLNDWLVTGILLRFNSWIRISFIYRDRQ
jgi:hypothetical protein